MRQQPQQQQRQRAVACSTSVLAHQLLQVAWTARPRAGALRGLAGQPGLLQGALAATVLPLLPLLRLLVMVPTAAMQVLVHPSLLSVLQQLALEQGFLQLLALQPLAAG